MMFSILSGERFCFIRFTHFLFFNINILSKLHHTSCLSYRKINAANSKNPRACKERTHEELHLKGDISWGADVQFKNEALMATRLANFISAFLQVVDPKEVFPGTRVVDKPLTEDQMIGNFISK